MVEYTAPTPQALQGLKDRLALSGQGMAELASVSGGQQWRKYTGGAQPREVNLHILFFMAARLVLDGDQLAAIAQEMRDCGARVGDIEPYAPGPYTCPSE